MLYDERIPIAGVNTSGSYLADDGIWYNIEDNHIVFKWSTIAHEMTHAIDKANGWISYNWGDLIIQDIRESISAQTTREYINQMLQAGISYQQIEYSVKNNTIEGAVNLILDRTKSADEKLSVAKKTFPSEQYLTVLEVQKYYNQEFSSSHLENSLAGDLYYGVTKGFITTALGHDLYDYWYTSKENLSELNMENLCAEYFANVLPAIYIGDEENKQAAYKYFPRATEEMLSVIDNLDKTFR